MSDKKTNLSHTIGHRVRLREKFTQGKLADYELLELLLTYAIPRMDVKPIAKDLLKTFGGMREILTASPEKLAAVSGIKQSTAIFLKLIHEITLIDFRRNLADTPIFHDFSVLENYCKTLLCGKTREEFHVLFLDPGYKLIEDFAHSDGTIDSSAIYPREIVKRALNLGARIVILLHNHPTDIPVFSEDDVNSTKELQSMLKSMHMELFDHLLVANGMIYSMKNMMLLN